jgi:hypothetical protein
MFERAARAAPASGVGFRTRSPAYPEFPAMGTCGPGAFSETQPTDPQRLSGSNRTSSAIAPGASSARNTRLTERTVSDGAPCARRRAGLTRQERENGEEDARGPSRPKTVRGGRHKGDDRSFRSLLLLNEHARRMIFEVRTEGPDPAANLHAPVQVAHIGGTREVHGSRSATLHADRDEVVTRPDDVVRVDVQVNPRVPGQSSQERGWQQGRRGIHRGPGAKLLDHETGPAVGQGTEDVRCGVVGQANRRSPVVDAKGRHGETFG